MTLSIFWQGVVVGFGIGGCLCGASYLAGRARERYGRGGGA